MSLGLLTAEPRKKAVQGNQALSRDCLSDSSVHPSDRNKGNRYCDCATKLSRAKRGSVLPGWADDDIRTEATHAHRASQGGKKRLEDCCVSYFVQNAEPGLVKC